MSYKKIIQAMTKTAMNLFKDQYESNKKEDSALLSPWLTVDIISSNCPRHTGVKLAKIGDNKFRCPKGNETYSAKANLASQTNKDRYDMGISF